MSSADLLAVFERLGRPHVLVLGDIILDRYTWGNADRISQEAPVIVLRIDNCEVRLGGAGNVCNMLRGLGAEVTYAGVVGDDSHGDTVRQLLRDVAVDTQGLLIDATRPTTVKERFIGQTQGRHPHQILRVDSEVRDPLEQGLESRLASQLAALIADYDALLISDYGKGVCTPRLLRVAIDVARAVGLPVLVDPIRESDYSRYHGATTMTPNRAEAGIAAGIPIGTHEEAVRAARQLCRDLELDFGIVTLDRDGIALVMPNGRGKVYPTQPRAVYDITGAGDMVLAMIGLCLASGTSPVDAVQLGNVAGGLEVEKVGVAVVSRAEIRARLIADATGRNPAAETKSLKLYSDQGSATEDNLLPITASHGKAAA